MESISIYDGLMLTIVSMLVVFIVLAAIWGLVELINRFIPEPEPERSQRDQPSLPITSNAQTDALIPNKEHQQVAEFMALILASEDEPDKKFEIIESKRIK